jgi:hypothetical protein
MIIHCTKKLAARLPSVSPEPRVEDSPLGSWHANFYTIDRRNCLMFCHDKTRFTLFMAGLKKPDFGRLEHWFLDFFANTLLNLAYEHELIMKATSLVGRLHFDTHCDRSVLATLNIARLYDLEGCLWQVPDVMDLLPYTTSARLCGRPVHLKGMRASECLFPDRAMKQFLMAI